MKPKDEAKDKTLDIAKPQNAVTDAVSRETVDNKEDIMTDISAQFEEATYGVFVYNDEGIEISLTYNLQLEVAIKLAKQIILARMAICEVWVHQWLNARWQPVIWRGRKGQSKGEIVDSTQKPPEVSAKEDIMVIDSCTHPAPPILHHLIPWYEWRSEDDLLDWGHHYSKGNMYCWMIRIFPSGNAYAVGFRNYGGTLKDGVETYIRRIVNRFGPDSVVRCTWIYGHSGLMSHNQQLAWLL